MAMRRVYQGCADVLFIECADHASIGRLVHVDVHVFETGNYLGVWSIEGQRALDGLRLTAEMVACLEYLGYKLVAGL